MADPATQFQSAGLQIPYQYTPVETRLNPPIHLDPVNYDAMQRGFSSLSDALTKGPFNPAVRAQMQAETARYNLEKEQLAYEDKLTPEQRARGMAIGPQGAEIVPGYQLGNVGGPGEPGTPDNTQQPQQPQQPQQNNQPQQPQQQNQPTTVNAPNPQVNAANTSNITSATQGGSSGINYPLPGQQPQGGQIQQKAEPQSPYNVPNAIKRPAAPPAPDGITQNQPIYMPGAGLQQQPAQPDQQSLLAWQQQNAHPVMSSQDALTWAKGFDTAIKRATYLPHGGPNNEPAFAFSDGKSQNVVPISQIRANGGQGLIAGQNTSAILNTADQVAQQQGQQPQQGQGPQQGQQPTGQAPQISPGAMQVAQQTAGQYGQYGNQTVPPAPGDFTPEQKAYIASQTGDPTVLSASTNNNFLLQKNAADNAARGDTQIAPNTIRDNASNVPRSTDPLHGDPIPPGEQPGQQDAAVQAQLAEVQKRPGGLNTLEDAGPEHPGIKKLGGPNAQTGVQWYVDSSPDPSKPDSHLPFLITQTSPWSERRMYNTVANEWIPVEVVRPDKILDKQIYEKLGLDSTGWNQGQKIRALRDDYNLHNTIPMTPDVQGKLESMRNQVLQSQRILEGIRDGKMTDSDWGWFRQIQNNVADNANILGGTWADAHIREAARAIAPGGVDPKLQYLSNAYNTLIKGREDPNLSAQEKAELDHITMGTTLPTQIQQLNHSRMLEYNRYYNQAVANRMRVSDDYMGTADEITANRRIRDGGVPNFGNLPTVRTDTGANPTATPPMVLRAQPVTSPTPAQPAATPIPVPANNNQKTPLDLTSYGRQGGIDQARRLPRGTWVKSGNNVFQVP